MGVTRCEMSQNYHIIIFLEKAKPLKMDYLR